MRYLSTIAALVVLLIGTASPQESRIGRDIPESEEQEWWDGREIGVEDEVYDPRPLTRRDADWDYLDDYDYYEYEPTERDLYLDDPDIVVDADENIIEVEDDDIYREPGLREEADLPSPAYDTVYEFEPDRDLEPLEVDEFNTWYSDEERPQRFYDSLRL